MMDKQTKKIIESIEYFVLLLALAMIGVLMGMMSVVQNQQDMLVIISMMNVMGILLADMLLFKIYREKK